LTPTAPTRRLHVARSDRAQAGAPYAARPAGPEILALGAWINGSNRELVIGETESSVSVSPDLARAVACDVDPRPREFAYEAHKRAIGVNNSCLFFKDYSVPEEKNIFSHKNCLFFSVLYGT
jgi:hypothetical protein